MTDVSPTHGGTSSFLPAPVMTDFLKKYNEIDRLSENGDTDTALRESGSALAEADNQWTKAYNSRNNTPDDIESFALMASQHCELLLSAGYTADTYGTALLSLLQTDIDGHTSARINRCAMILYETALVAMIKLSESTPADDNDCREHMSYIMHYLSSMLYHYYRKVGAESPGFDALHSAYNLLKQMEPLGVVSEKITMAGKEEQTDPASSREILADLIGRSRALGWITT